MAPSQCSPIEGHDLRLKECLLEPEVGFPQRASGAVIGAQ